jgi:hypothetical protein
MKTLIGLNKKQAKKVLDSIYKKFGGCYSEAGTDIVNCNGFETVRIQKDEKGERFGMDIYNINITEVFHQMGYDIYIYAKDYIKDGLLNDKQKKIIIKN